MAKTFYKFAERSAESQINWNEVGRQLSDVVNEEARVRQEKKAAIDQQIGEFNEYINNPPLGDHQGFNEWTSQFAADTSQYALQVERLLKSGQLNMRDYTNIRANLNQGTTEAFEFGKEFNTKYAELQARMEVDPETGLPQAQALEEYLMNSTRGLGNFNSSRLWINPTDGKVMLGELDPATGEMIKNPDAYAPVNELRNRLNAKYDTYNVNAATDPIAEQLGTRIDAIMDGRVKERENPLENPDIVQAIDDAVSSQVADPFNVTSLLTNSLSMNPNTGEMFNFTNDPIAAAKDPNLILLVPNPMQPSSGASVPLFNLEKEAQLKEQLTGGDNPKMTEEQYDAMMANRDAQLQAARDVVETNIKSKLDYKEEGYERKDRRAQTPDERKSGAAKKQAQRAVTNLAKLWGTSIPESDYFPDGRENATDEELRAYNDAVQEEFQAAGNFLAGLNDEVHSIEFSEDGSQIIINDRGSDGRPIPRTPITKGDDVELFVESVVSALLPDDVQQAADVRAMLDASGIVDGLSRHSQTTGENPFGFDAPAPEPAPQPMTFRDTVDDGFGEPISLEMLAEESFPEPEKNASPNDIGLATRNAFSSYLQQAGIPNAQIINGVEVIDEGNIIGYGREELAYVNVAIPGVTETSIVFPAELTPQQWKAINEKILSERAKGNQITPQMFSNLGIENFMDIQSLRPNAGGGGGPLD